ncbi:heme-binding Shp domain-containing protein [uncultured Flavonifractor sp.]|uniref:heme-binding Shp domain-containing protein n=1 Tax=uncultured Flavonifractor sp. TaxID=1193534 RepID=UPI0025D4ACA0|nr:heme-binding Shp domain-containing protein [uncultured Flavonifractor sp.]
MTSIKRILYWLSPLVLMLMFCALPAKAAGLEPGVYTGTMVTTYYNPDTGNVDDGGTANAALGEGMCRSATDEACLVEVDQEGNVWITVRLLLQSNCKNVALYTRTGYDSYSKVSYDIMSEDAGNDSIDYRIKVSDAGVKLKGTMYVTPMGRDVLWYLYVDTSTLKEGSGDFVVSIDTSAPQEPATPEPEAPASTPSTPATSNPAPSTPSTTAPATPSASDSQDPEETPENSADPVQSEEPVDSPLPEETDPLESTEPTETSDAADETPATSPEPEQDEASSGSTDEEAPASAGVPGGVIAAIVVVAAIVVGAVIYFVKRKK